MYKILTNGRLRINRFFTSYEAARSYARTILRKKYKWEYRNPPLSLGGYEIKAM